MPPFTPQLDLEDNFVAIKYAEVSPLYLDAELTTHSVKLELIEWSLRSLLLPGKSLRVDTRRGEQHTDLYPLLQDESVIFALSSSNPSQTERIPCRVLVYLPAHQRARFDHCCQVSIDSCTTCAISLPNSCWNSLVGLTPADPFPDTTQITVTHNHSTVLALKLRLGRLLGRPILIGTRPWTRSEHDLMAAAQQYIMGRVGTTTAARMCSGALLVHSPDRGAGKSALTRVVAHDLGAMVYSVSVTALLVKYGIYADLALQTNLHAAVWKAAVRKKPVVILVDGMECMCPLAGSHGDAAAPILQSIQAYLQTLATGLEQQQQWAHGSTAGHDLYQPFSSCDLQMVARVALVAIMTCPDRSLPKLRAFDSYRCPSLTSTTRREAMRWAVEQESAGNLVVHGRIQDHILDFATSAVIRGQQFRALAKAVRASLSSPTAPDLDRLRLVLGSFQGSNLQISLPTQGKIPEKSVFQSIGGNEAAKQALEDAVAFNERRLELLSAFNLPLSTGVLLYGVPGTGKTLLAKAIAERLRHGESLTNNRCNAFIALQSSDLILAHVGEGEKILFRTFEEAWSNAPSVIFVDEFQALFHARSSGGSSSRLSSTLLQCLDSLRQWRDAAQDVRSRVLVVAATNTPWAVDAAFLRPGRFDRTILVDLPSQEDRVGILRLYTGRMQTFMSDDDVLERLAQETKGFTGADLASLCRAAATQCILDGHDLVTYEHFECALVNDVRPSTDPDLRRKVLEWRGM